MKSFLIKSACGIGALTLVCLAIQPSDAPTTTSRVVTAANAFLSTLDEKQRKSVLYSFDDEEQRKRWSNFPTGFVPRGGMFEGHECNAAGGGYGPKSSHALLIR